ncbi:DUF2953 domain-containing protein [Paenibacillus antri]|nr:DUF2953 domain-containing protein [Paenibacillus antri]
MWWWIASAAALAVLIVVVLLSSVRVRLKYYREGENDEVDASLSALFGLVRLRYKVPTVELKPWLNGIRMKVAPEETSGVLPELDFAREEIRRFVQRVRKLIAHMKNYKRFFADTLKHVHVVELRWDTRFGLTDAAETGMTGGVVWGLKSALLGVASRWMSFERLPSVTVTPVFNQPTFRTEIVIRTRMKVFRIIAIGAMLVYRVLKRRGGWIVWLRVLLGRSPKESTA